MKFTNNKSYAVRVASQVVEPGASIEVADPAPVEPPTAPAPPPAKKVAAKKVAAKTAAHPELATTPKGES